MTDSFVRVESETKALVAAAAAFEKQAEGLVVMDLRRLSTVTDFFLICTAASGRQISALTEHLDATFTQRGWRVWHTEGNAQAAFAPRGPNDELQWVLMDCGELVVHLFNERARAFYRLEELWADAPRLPLGTLPHSSAQRA